MADIQVGTIKDIAKSKVDFDAEQLSSYFRSNHRLDSILPICLYQRKLTKILVNKGL